MADTIRTFSPDATCDDCGVLGCSWHHWGPLVPKTARVLNFCDNCWTERQGYYVVHNCPKPLGKNKSKSEEKHTEKKDYFARDYLSK